MTLTSETRFQKIRLIYPLIHRCLEKFRIKIEHTVLHVLKYESKGQQGEKRKANSIQLISKFITYQNYIRSKWICVTKASISRGVRLRQS